jgi:cell division septum initiation protein DivIVA
VSDSGELATVRERAESDAPMSHGSATSEAQHILAAARAEAEAVRTSAEQTAAALVRRAQQQAATIEERARQELFWYRRQLRRERDVITRCQRALVDQLTMLSGVAAETAKSLYDSPEPTFMDEDLALPLDDELLEFAQSEGA